MIRKKNFRTINAWVWKHWGIGYGVIIGRFYGLVNFVLLLSTFLLAKGFEISFLETIIYGLVICAIVFILGVLYAKFDFQKAEFSQNFKEQPELVQMKKDIEEIKLMLSSLRGEKQWLK